MKKGLILFAALLIITGAASVHAQGLLGYGLPGVPMFGGGGPGAYGPYARPFFTPPTFYVGWMESYKHATFGYDDTDFGTLLGIKHRYPLSGLWLGLEEKINVGENCEIILDGWVLVPSNRRGTEQEVNTFAIGTIGGQFASIQGGRSWNARPDWWYIDALGACGCSKTFMVLAGFRYEHFSVQLNDPQDPVFVAITGDDRADLTVNSYQPLVGVQYRLGGGSGGSINVRMMGFPYVPADVKFYQTATGGTTRVESNGNFKDSYFFEIFAQAERNIFGDANIGAFFRWNLLHGRARLNSELVPGGLFNNEDRATLDRNTLTFGGSFSLNFVTPY
ncbi:MAG: hypothetical protein HY913_24345 [Desulfomonile tiedjei]|nr:hypothetical protein [Desulfomonile tiedjei]